MTAILRGRGLVYARGGRRLLDGIDIDLNGGVLTAVVGPNGAGKSTLLRVLAGEVRPSEGSVTFAGEPLASLSPWRLAHGRALMPQSAYVSLPFTVLDIARLGADGIGRGLSAGDRLAIAHAALEAADVAHLAARPIQALSGGERQRIHFARVLAQLRAGRTLEPRQVLLLDEPASSLDLRHQLDLFAAVSNLLDEGVAVLAVLHDLQLAAALSRDLVLLEAGRIIARGDPAEVLAADRMETVFGVRPDGGKVPPFPWTRRRSG